MLTEDGSRGGTGGFPERANICAIVVTYNIGEAIHRCFDSIREQVAHIVIVDNGSDELTRRELDKLAQANSTTLILNEKNEGIARALNQGIRCAIAKGYTWLLTLDHDSEATPGMVDRLAQAYITLHEQGLRDVAAVGANALDRNAGLFLSALPPRDTGGMPVELEHLISSGCLINGRVFDVVGPFNEQLFVYYVDTDFCLRLQRGGLRLFLCPEAVLLHSEGNKETHRFLGRRVLYNRYGKYARYYITRNCIYIMKTYGLGVGLSHQLIRRFFSDHAKLLLYDQERFSKMMFSLRGFLDGMRGRFGPMGSWGMNTLQGS